VSPDAAAQVVLELRGVRKQFASGGRTLTALRGVSLGVGRGRVTGLIGPDGAGKTTLMRLSVGLLVPDEGQITALGHDTARDPLAVQSSVGYMPQRFGLYEDLTVQENLDLYSDLQGVAAADRAGRYGELMHMTGLARFTGRLAGRLSGGMKQKLGLACTLVRPPQLLLLDEPTVGVDPVSRRELWQIVYRLVREHAMTVLLSTAYLDEAERCDDIVLLHEGEILGKGRPGEFREPLRGRTFSARAPAIGKRAFQKAVSAVPGVLDAVIQADRVRVVAREGAADIPGQIARAFAGSTAEAVEPRLEDAFVALLLGRGEARAGAGPLPARAAPAAGTPHRPAAFPGPVIEVRDVSRKFGDFDAVRSATFDVAQGEVFGLLGPNGAGKSTTFRMLCGLLPPSAGTLRVAGLDLRHAASAARARIGYMSQKFSLYGNLSVLENLRFFSSAYDLFGRRQDGRIAWALSEFGLAEYVSMTSQDLSLGHKQRLAMACALMHEPDILFLDEPTSGVDPIARREFWSRINALAEGGVTILVTTHFMEEAEYCDRLAIMADGEVLTIGDPASIKRGQRSEAMPEPSMEDAFIGLIERRARGAEAA
jgi:ABC-2 type transport system ATP-binding protein